MPRAKQIPASANEIVRVRAAKGHVLPIFYRGSIIHIDDSSAVEIDRSKLEYEPKIQFENALADQHLIEESK